MLERGQEIVIIVVASRRIGVSVAQRQGSGPFVPHC